MTLILEEIDCSSLDVVKVSLRNDRGDFYERSLRNVAGKAVE